MTSDVDVTDVAPLPRRRVLVAFGGLMTGMFLAALDQTIVATSLPTIAGDLGGLEHISWVVTAYLLTETAAIPLFGKLSDVYGRRRLFQLAIVVLLIGSVLAGLSQNMVQLVAARAIQGIGGGGLVAMSQTIIGDLVSPRERGRYQGLMGSVFAVATVVGPAIGGLIVDNLSWRWVFYVNIPVGLLALAITSRALDLPFTRRENKVDVVGAVLLVGLLTAVVFATTWGGSEHAWSSPVIVGLILASAVLLVAFVAREQRAPDPILPLRLFRFRNFTVAAIAGFFVGFTLFGATVFLPVFLQLVSGVSATASGLLLLPVMGGLLVTSIGSGQLITYWGRYKIFPVVGTALMAVGLVLLSRMDADTTGLASSLSMIVLGAGVGMVMQVLILAVQNTVEHRDLGIATASASLFRSLGGAVGTATFGAIFAAQLTGNLGDLGGAAAGLDADAVLGSPAQIAALPNALHDQVVDAFANSLHVVFLCAVPTAILAFIAVLFMRERPLRTTTFVGAPTEPITEAAADPVSALDEPIGASPVQQLPDS